ncbi:hypothetical protein BDN67DRAFT_868629, partial [Paxillus ammoniavirescens]
DWVARLLAIEFAINLAWSETTGNTPFFPNTGCLPQAMILETLLSTEYPGVRVYAQRMKHTLMIAHDSILDACAKQTRDANRKHRRCPFTIGDLVYL